VELKLGRTRSARSLFSLATSPKDPKDSSTLRGGWVFSAVRISFLPKHRPTETPKHLFSLAHRSGHRLLQRLSPQKQIPSSLELFGKRFNFRDRGHLRDLHAPLNFQQFHLAGSGHIYDVEVFEKSASRE
jgi:hypothetical protein